jgi:hypothetical protein
MIGFSFLVGLLDCLASSATPCIGFRLAFEEWGGGLPQADVWPHGCEIENYRNKEQA